ncbi:MAG: diacylglycerol kinase family protein [Candidatus Nanopelagicales bacterium]
MSEVTAADHVVVVLNPASGGAMDRPTFDKAMAEAGLAANVVETTDEDPGHGIASRALSDGARVVVAVGGDGTVRACLDALVGTEAALAIVPTGTGNLLARNLDLPDDPARALGLVISGARRTMDVGRANGEAFAVMAGSGLDALMIRDANATVKEHFGPVAYALSAVRHLRSDLVETRVRVDGEVVLDARTAMVLIGNCGRLQAGVQVFPEARPDDGRLDVAALSPRSVLDWLRVGTAVLRRRPAPDRLVRRFSGKRIDVLTRRPRAWELDGEDRPPTELLRCEVVAGALLVCGPPVEGHGLEES